MNGRNSKSVPKVKRKQKKKVFYALAKSNSIQLKRIRIAKKKKKRRKKIIRTREKIKKWMILNVTSFGSKFLCVTPIKKNSKSVKTNIWWRAFVALHPWDSSFVEIFNFWLLLAIFMKNFGVTFRK